MSVRAIRGATVTNENTSASILSDTSELLERMLAENDVQDDDLISIFFSLTDDLDAVFPAVSARRLGLMDVPLLCLNEIPVPGSLERCIRVLIHFNTDQSNAEIRHIYLKEAVKLRPDQMLGSND